MSDAFLCFLSLDETLILVHYSTTLCVSVRLLVAAYSARTKTCFPRSLDEYFNRSPFIFNRVTGSQRSTEEAVDSGQGPLSSRSRLVCCNSIMEQVIFNS